MHGPVTALLAAGLAMRVLDDRSPAAVDTLWLAVGAVASTAAVAVVGSTAAVVADMAVVVDTGNRCAILEWETAGNLPAVFFCGRHRRSTLLFWRGGASACHLQKP